MAEAPTGNEETDAGSQKFPRSLARSAMATLTKKPLAAQLLFGSFDKSILLFEIQSGTILGNVQSLWKIAFLLCESSE